MGKSFKNFVTIKAAKWLIIAILWLIYLTCKKEFIYPKFDKNFHKKAVVMLFWHGKLAMMPFFFIKVWKKVRKSTKVIISDHKDGEIITQVSASFGIGAVRGSSRKGGAKALIDAIKELKNGGDIVITPDGPKGPYHSISDGCVIIPQKTDSKIVILECKFSKFWQFKSWDKMQLPKPFSTIIYELSEPFSIENLPPKIAKEKIAQKWSEICFVK